MTEVDQGAVAHINVSANGQIIATIRPDGVHYLCRTGSIPGAYKPMP